MEISPVTAEKTVTIAFSRYSAVFSVHLHLRKYACKLVYIDPPFATEEEFRASQGEIAYQDKIKGAEFVEFLRKRLFQNFNI